jgi:hypothetical protein
LYTDKKKREAKKLNESAFARIALVYQLIGDLVGFLTAFYEFLLSLDCNKLRQFMDFYEHHASEEITTFIAGLKKDLTAVQNCLLYPKISNGPMEGTNNKIKMVRRRSFGRAGIELLNALLVLPWYYKEKAVPVEILLS